MPTKVLSQHSQRGQEVGEGMGPELVLSRLNQSSVVISRRKEDGFGVTCSNGEACWRPMVTTHWPHLLNHTGSNMEGR